MLNAVISHVSMTITLFGLGLAQESSSIITIHHYTTIIVVSYECHKIDIV